MINMLIWDKTLLKNFQVVYGTHHCSFRESIYLIKTDTLTSIVFYEQPPRSSEETQEQKYGLQVPRTWLKLQCLRELFRFVNRSLGIINVSLT